jgi:serine/threonine protein kinase
MRDVKDNAKTVFLEALDCTGPGELDRFLDQACATDAALRARVEELLLAHRDAGNFLGRLDPPEVTRDEPLGEGPGTMIGPYQLLEQIGEGGMGLVFAAEQQQPIRRKVALKVLKPGMDTRQVIARFEAERQALALMNHPNIAKVLDAGQTSSGRPYFVMELVKGLPITEFCDQSLLTTKERLELFVTVCHAVQHAHQKGIIHRDIKPSNVLVTPHDGTPEPKIIDFGIAKALGQQLTDKTLFSGFAQMIGTPLYMSPEQAALSNADVDTRSDIYSLGVLLYELLTSTTPFDRERFKEVGYDELRRIIREEEPPKPSTRISTMGQASTTISTQRKSDPKRLSQLLRGELDWIVLKALEKDRERRFETASAFAADVQRYFNDEPVQACPPSAGYRLRKFVRRNRGLVLASLLVLLAAIAGSIGVLQARRVAAEMEAREKAETREAHTKSVLEFVENKIFAVDWQEGAGGIVAMEEIDPVTGKPPLQQIGKNSQTAGGPWREGEPFVEMIAAQACKRDLSGGNLHIVVALVPDPLEGPPMEFDSAVDAIQRAGERHDYVLDRYWFPWSVAGEDAGRVNGRRLGLLLFRKQQASHPRQFLLIFLASDTAITGMHK